MATQKLYRSPEHPFYERWMNPHDSDAKVTKLMDGRTRLGHKVEETVDLETGAVVVVTAPEELGDRQTLGETLRMAQEEMKAVESGAQVREVVAGKGYHSNETVLELKTLGLRGYLSETDRGRRNWKGKNRKYQLPEYANRRRIRGRRGRRLQRQRSELVERPFAHQFRTGGLRRVFVRGRVLARLFSVFGAKMGRWFGWNQLWERFWAPIEPDSLFRTHRTHQYTISTSACEKNNSRRNQDFCHGLLIVRYDRAVDGSFSNA